MIRYTCGLCHLRCRHRAHFSFFFFNDTATTEIYTLSLHDALPISGGQELLAHGSVPSERLHSGAEMSGDFSFPPDYPERRHALDQRSSGECAGAFLWVQLSTSHAG